jgi:pilus assembly protein FimV
LFRLIAIALFAVALSCATLAAHAAGLGKLTVLSALGQPLNAEIEIVSLQAGEEDSLSARVASPEAFKQAAIDFNAVLLGLRFSVERRGSRAFLRLTTPQPVNEPFVEMLVELQWNTGRLVREYTFLLDPIEYKGPIAAAPVTPAPRPVPAPAAAPQPPVEAAKPEAAKPEAEQPPQAAAAPEAPKPEPGQQPIEAKPLDPAPAPATPAAAPAEPRPATATVEYEVKKGDTLGKIARQHLAPGVNLDQMLIAIYRANQDAFIRDNINLVRAGRILTIPPADGAGTLDPQDARRLVRAHHADFNAYRARLGAIPTTAEATPGTQAAAGRIEPKPAPAPEPKQDQLRLSRADPQKPVAPAARAAQGDDIAARQRALGEAQSRAGDLEKSVSDLQKLLELKNQQLAQLQKQAAAPAAPAAPAPAAKAPEKPAPAPAPAAKAPEKPAAPAPTAPEKPAAAPAAPVPAAPAPAAKAPEKPAAEAPKPAAPAPKAEAPKPKPGPEAAKPPAKKAAAEPSIIDEFLDNELALASLGGVVLLLIGYGAWAWRRKKRSQAKFHDSVLDAASGSGAASVFGAAAGGAAAAGASQASVSQAPAGMEAEEVDPIAEADVYMAYGRDAQAEEILKEALAKDANRTAVHAKLAEIYANRKDAKSFEQSAVKLKSLTNGSGPEWDKTAALGRALDPQNGLYGAGGGAAAVAPAAAIAAAPAAAAPTLDFDLGGGTSPGTAAPDISLDAPREAAPAPNLDFDLGAAASAPAASGTPESDFTPAGTLIMEHKASDAGGGLDFDLGLSTGNTQAPAAPAAAPAADSGGLDFDLNLDTGEKSGGDKPAPAAPSMDLSAISLDLGTSTDASGGGSADPKWQEVATKLDLAKAYEEMGDKNGARELLNEVMKDGDAAQQGQAQQLLAKLG